MTNKNISAKTHSPFGGCLLKLCWCLTEEPIESQWVGYPLPSPLEISSSPISYLVGSLPCIFLLVGSNFPQRKEEERRRQGDYTDLCTSAKFIGVGREYIHTKWKTWFITILSVKLDWENFPNWILITMLFRETIFCNCYFLYQFGYLPGPPNF